jgi:hypothetical protein
MRSTIPRAAKADALKKIHVPVSAVIVDFDKSDLSDSGESDDSDQNLQNYLGNYDLSQAEMELDEIIAQMAEVAEPMMVDPSPPPSNDIQYVWQKHPLYYGDTAFQGQLPSAYHDPTKPPLSYFKKLVSDEMLHHIASQSNLFHIQQKGEHGHQTLDYKDIESYVGVLIMNGCLKYPNMRMHWAKGTRTPAVADNMSRNSFDYINGNLHFNDNSKLPSRNSPDYNKLYKVQPLINMFNDALRCIEFEPKLSVDEQMIPTRGRSPFRQYMPGKPHKWGIKVWALCSQDGVLHRFEIYKGKENIAREMGVGESVVLKFSQEIPEFKNYTLGFDNYFSSLRLLVMLRQRGINGVGTIRSNRLRQLSSEFEDDKSLKKRGRGAFDWRCDHQNLLTVVKWQDKSAITVASNFLPVELGTPAERFNVTKREYEAIPRPLAIEVYNQVMNGVDVNDQAMAYYRIGLKSRKWYKYIFFYILNVAAANSWLLYRRDCQLRGLSSIPLLAFSLDIGEALLTAKRPTVAPARKRGRPTCRPPAEPEPSTSSVRAPHPNSAMRYDLVDHFPQYCEKQMKCRLCARLKKTSYTFVTCGKCKMALCFTRERNCFYLYHHQ